MGWVGLGHWVDGLGWVGSGHRKWTHGQLWFDLVAGAFRWSTRRSGRRRRVKTRASNRVTVDKLIEVDILPVRDVGCVLSSEVRLWKWRIDLISGDVCGRRYSVVRARRAEWNDYYTSSTGRVLVDASQHLLHRSPLLPYFIPTANHPVVAASERNLHLHAYKPRSVALNRCVWQLLVVVGCRNTRRNSSSASPF